MDWMGGLREALAYIEENLAGDISYAQAAKPLHCSADYFQRIFAILADVPLSEYIRMRRLSRAAEDLQTGHGRIIDVALRYGYESPSAFARAFAAMHGVSPSRARKMGVRLKAYPPVSFRITVKGAVSMAYRIEETKAFRVVGKRLDTRDVEGENNEDIPAFWGKCELDGTLARLRALDAPDEGVMTGLLGLCGPLTSQTERTFAYYIAVSTAEECPEDFETLEVAGATYAVFETAESGTEAAQALWVSIFSEWFPASGYRLGEAMDFERYPPVDEKTSDSRMEVWIPVVKD